MLIEQVVLEERRTSLNIVGTYDITIVEEALHTFEDIHDQINDMIKKSSNRILQTLVLKSSGTKHSDTDMVWRSTQWHYNNPVELIEY